MMILFLLDLQNAAHTDLPATTAGVVKDVVRIQLIIVDEMATGTLEILFMRAKVVERAQSGEDLLK